MLAEIGHFALILALSFGILNAGVALYAARRPQSFARHLYPQGLYAQFAALTTAFIILAILFAHDDFSVLAVYNNSHSLQPILYKITAVWGNHEGSLLLWVWVLSLFSHLYLYLGAALDARLRATAVTVQILLGCGFLLFLIFTSNPFQRLIPYPPQGQSLNPLLQDPGLVIHPPLLYIGYVGLSAVFSLAMAVLIKGDLTPAAIRLLRQFALIAWVFLTAGIALGSWWAYYELGWGGFWFWDPVENAAFIPWLTTTALLHSAIVTEKRKVLKIWTLLLSLMAFAFSLIGTFLVRSGILTSVHAFANDPQRGLYILILMSTILTIGFGLFACRAARMRDGRGLFRPISREGGLMLNNLLLAPATAVVLIGTLFPLFAEFFWGNKITVGPPYFNLTFIPPTFLALLLMGIVPLLAWKRAACLKAIRSLWLATAVAISGIIAALFLLHTRLSAILALAFGVWLALAVLTQLYYRSGRRWRRVLGLPYSDLGMTVAHFGIAVVFIGISAASLLSEDKIFGMRPGETFEFRRQEVKLVQIRRFEKDNYFALQAEIHVQDGSRTKILRPERRLYIGSRQTTTEAAIKTSLKGDFYASISEKPDNATANSPAGANFFAAQEFIVHIHFKPLAVFLWFGAGLMVLGGVLALWRRVPRKNINPDLPFESRF